MSNRVLLRLFVALFALAFLETPGRAYGMGGMWMPSQVGDLEQELAELGITVDPNQLSNPASPLLKSIISLGFCSGSFVSPNGMIFTNHHCVQQMLAYLSNKDAEAGKQIDHFTQGFHASSNAEERNVGPGQSVFVTQKITDVTERILQGLADIKDPVARAREMDRRRLAIIAESEKGRPEIRAELTSFFSGAQFLLIEKLRIQDVRLVFAPPAGIGFFGGDDMNFAYPRYTGDFAVIRAYVGKDGKPAPYSPDNVPFQSEAHLNISAAGMKEGDGVFVAGFPGRTFRLIPTSLAQFKIEQEMPWAIATYQQIIAKLDELSARSPELKRKADDSRMRLMNALQGQSMTLEALLRSGFLPEKAERERQLYAWIKADPDRDKKFGHAVSHAEDYTEKVVASFESDALLGLVQTYPGILNSLLNIAKFAEERERPDADREPGYQDRDLEITARATQSGAAAYSREIAVELFTLVIEKAMASREKLDLPWLGEIIDFEALKSGKSVRDQLQAYYETTGLEDVERRIELLKTATTSSLKENKDPMLQLALRLRTHLRRMEDRNRALTGEGLLVMPVYAQAQREFHQGRLAPDANSTLRLTFGKVTGTMVEGQPVAATTHLGDMLALAELKERKFPYAAPETLFQAVKENPALADQTVNTLMDVDITGGNSGSAIINGKGNLVGLVFDGLKSSLQASFNFGPSVRNIGVSSSFVLEVLKMYNAKHVLNEITLVDTEGCEGNFH